MKANGRGHDLVKKSDAKKSLFNSALDANNILYTVNKIC